MANEAALSHVDVARKAKQLVAELLEDAFLCDLPRDISSDDVTSLLALEQGKAITVNVRKMDDQLFRKLACCLLDTASETATYIL